MGKGKPFFTLEDFKASFNLFCCVYGIGTLGMPGNFSRAGPVIATLALLFMAFANVYSSVCISKTMLLAPRSVKTYGDLGEWCMGKTGRYLTVIAQMGNCLLVPCAFLVLGGTLLDDLFPGAFSPKTWIILMAILVTPVCLIPTLKEGAGVALAGCLGTILGDVLGVSLLLHGMSGHPSVPSPDLNFKQVATAFGNLSLAYGAGIVIPALQRQHSDPTRMPRVVFVTVTFISVLFLCLASTGYSAVGCQISGNLLFSIYPDATTGLTPLGFTVDKGLVVLAFLGMQLHITIAFNVIIAPAFYILERMLLGMHPIKPIDDIESVAYEAAETPGDGIKTRASKGSVVSMADIAKENDDEDAELMEYKGHALKYIPMRIAVVVVLVIASVLFRDHFGDLTDFVGASAITLSCIVLPIIFYLKKCWSSVPIYEKIPGIIVILVCLFFGCYVTYTSGKQLFNPDDTSPTDPVFPFCAPDHEYEVYYTKDNSTRF